MNYKCSFMWKIGKSVLQKHRLIINIVLALKNMSMQNIET